MACSCCCTRNAPQAEQIAAIPRPQSNRVSDLMGTNAPKLCFRLGVLIRHRFLFGLLLVHVVHVVHVVWFFLVLHLYFPATSSDEFDLFLHKNTQSFHSFSPFLHVACMAGLASPFAGRQASRCTLFIKQSTVYSSNS